MTDFQHSRDRESHVEDAVVAWAENNGFLPRFMSYRGRRGCPDVFFFGFGEIVMMEFKKPGEEPDPLQKREHWRLASQGLTVYVIDRAEDGIRILNNLKRMMPA